MGLKQQIEKKFETFYKTNKTRKAFDELYQDVLVSLADHEKTRISRKQVRNVINELGHTPVPDHFRADNSQTGWLDGVGFSIRKFRKLLEEESP